MRNAAISLIILDVAFAAFSDASLFFQHLGFVHLAKLNFRLLATGNNLSTPHRFCFLIRNHIRDNDSDIVVVDSLAHIRTFQVVSDY